MGETWYILDAKWWKSLQRFRVFLSFFLSLLVFTKKKKCKWFFMGFFFLCESLCILYISRFLSVSLICLGVSVYLETVAGENECGCKRSWKSPVHQVSILGLFVR